MKKFIALLLTAAALGVLPLLLSGCGISSCGCLPPRSETSGGTTTEPMPPEVEPEEFYSVSALEAYVLSKGPSASYVSLAALFGESTPLANFTKISLYDFPSSDTVYQYEFDGYDSIVIRYAPEKYVYDDCTCKTLIELVSGHVTITHEGFLIDAGEPIAALFEADKDGMKAKIGDAIDNR